MMSDRDLGRLEARLERLESTRQRFLDLLPLTAVLALLAGQWGFLWAQFAAIDDRLDRLEARLVQVDTRLGRLEDVLGRIEQKLAPP